MAQEREKITVYSPIRAQCPQAQHGCALIWKAEPKSFPTVYDNTYFVNFWQTGCAFIGSAPLLWYFGNQTLWSWKPTNSYNRNRWSDVQALTSGCQLFLSSITSKMTPCNSVLNRPKNSESIIGTISDSIIYSKSIFRPNLSNGMRGNV